MTNRMLSSGRKVETIMCKAAVLVAAAMATPAIAATYTWTGTAAGNWSNGANWDVAGKPVTDGTADIVFKAGNFTSTIDSAWAVSGSINSLTLDSSVTTGNLALAKGSGVTGLTIASGGITNSSSKGLNPVNVGTLTLGASQKWTNTGDIRIDSANLVSASNVVLTKEGTGSVYFQGSGNYANFLGSVVLNQGTITFNGLSNYGSLGTQTLTVGNVGSTGVTIANAGNGTFSQAMQFNNTSVSFTFSVNNVPGTLNTTVLSGSWSGTLAGDTNGRIVFGGHNDTGRSTVWKISGNNSGLTKTATADADILAGKYPFYVRTGLVIVDSDNALGTGNYMPVAIGNANSTTFSGYMSGLLATNGHHVSGPIRYRSSTATATSSPGIGVLGLEGPGSVIFSGNIYLNTSANANQVGTLQLTAPTGGTAIFNGKMIDSGADNNTIQANKSRLAVMGQGTVELNGDSTYQGTTTVRSGTLVVGHQRALGGAISDVSLGDVTIPVTSVKVAPTTSALPSLGTYSPTAGTITFGSAQNQVDGIDIVDGDRILVYSHVFNGGASTSEGNGIYVRTSGTVWTRVAELNEASEFAYGQQVTVQSGTVNGGKSFYLSNRLDAAPITSTFATTTPGAGLGYSPDYLNPEAAILLKSGVTLSRNINVVANTSTGKSILGSTATSGVGEFTGAIALNRALTVTAASGGEARFSGNITGGFGITKEGAGKVSFDGNKTYTGVTAVTAGVLEVNGNLASTQVDIVAGGTLAGSGNLAGVVVSNGGTLSPGNSPGTMTIAGLTLDAASNLNYDLSANDLTIGAGVNDMIQINGNLTLAGTLNVAVYGGTELSFGTYRLMNYTGTLTNNTLQLAGGLSATRTYQIDTNTAGQVNLVVSAIPEPASLGLLTFGSVLIAARPRNPRKLTK